MMYHWQLLLQCLQDMRARKLRCFFIMLGIVWGSYAVTMLMALGESFQKKSEQEIFGAVDNAVFVWLNNTSKAYRGFPEGRVVRLENRDFEKIKALSSVKGFVPVFRSFGHARFKNKHSRASVQGVNEDYEYLLHRKDFHGRLFNASDVRENARVIFLGSAVKESLFGKSDAIGKVVYVKNEPFRVIGYNQNLKSQTFVSNRRDAYVPYTTFQMLWGQMRTKHFWLIPNEAYKTSQMLADVRGIVRHRFGAHPEDKKVVGFYDLSQGREFVASFFKVLNVFLGGCGLISLLVGATTVANTLFLTIKERTSEIGLQMAIGAKPKTILYQFIFEAMVMVFIAGFIGLLLSLASLALLSFAPLPNWLGTPHLSWQTFFTSFALLAVIGVLAGLLPAIKAARMQPAKALVT